MEELFKVEYAAFKSLAYEVLEDDSGYFT